MKTIYDELLGHFLTDFSTENPERKLELYVRQILLQHYSRQVVDDFIAQQLSQLQESLVREYNDRTACGDSIRYRFVDDDSEIIAGIGGMASPEKIAFQDGLKCLTPSEFESFSAHVLRMASCNRVWRTQQTHDEGLDAFGYMPFFHIKNTWVGGSPEVVFLAQAKHYNDTKVGSKDIREFVGAKQLANSRIFSKYEGRYKDLSIKPFSPVALVFVTSQEIPRTVKHMARASGIVVLTSDDLCPLFFSATANVPTPITQAWVAQEIRTVCAGIPEAK